MVEPEKRPFIARRVITPEGEVQYFPLEKSEKTILATTGILFLATTAVIASEQHETAVNAFAIAHTAYAISVGRHLWKHVKERVMSGEQDEMLLRSDQINGGNAN